MLVNTSALHASPLALRQARGAHECRSVDVAETSHRAATVDRPTGRAPGVENATPLHAFSLQNEVRQRVYDTATAIAPSFVYPLTRWGVLPRKSTSLRNCSHSAGTLCSGTVLTVREHLA